MTRRSNERDNPHGCNRYRCSSCHETLGYVRRIALVRGLKTFPDVEAVAWENGTLERTCLTCQTVNRFRWRVLG